MLRSNNIGGEMRRSVVAGILSGLMVPILHTIPASALIVSVPCTGSSDATHALNSAIKNAANGDTVQLTSGCTYLSNDIIQIRHPLTFDGNGATLLSTDDTVPAQCAVPPRTCPQWWIRNSTVAARPHV